MTLKIIFVLAGGLVGLFLATGLLSSPNYIDTSGITIPGYMVLFMIFAAVSVVIGWLFYFDGEDNGETKGRDSAYEQLIPKMESGEEGTILASWTSWEALVEGEWMQNPDRLVFKVGLARDQRLTTEVDMDRFEDKGAARKLGLGSKIIMTSENRIKILKLIESPLPFSSQPLTPSAGSAS